MRFYETVPLAAANGIDLGADPVDASVWVALLVRSADAPNPATQPDLEALKDDVRRRIAGRTLSLGMVPYLTDATRQVKQDLPLYEHSVLLAMVVVVALLVAYLWSVRPKSLRSLVDTIPTVRPTMHAFVIVAALGFVLNDPGVSIPGMMAVVLESSVVYLSARSARDRPTDRPLIPR